VRNVVVHLISEQPVLVDTFGLPEPNDTTLVCTNVRTTTGRRPVWVDDMNSIFYFPWLHVRFLEVPPAAVEMVGGFVGSDSEPAGGPTGGAGGPAEVPAVVAAPVVDDADLEIDEDFLRRVRDA
jgi:hypothetical protein